MGKCVGVAVTIVTLACASIALAGQAATNSNGDFIDLNVAVTPPVAGTAKAPQGVGVSFDSFVGNRISVSNEATSTSIVGLSAPVFATGIFLLYVFGVYLGWFPSFGGGDGGIVDRREVADEDDPHEHQEDQDDSTPVFQGMLDDSSHTGTVRL